MKVDKHKAKASKIWQNKNKNNNTVPHSIKSDIAKQQQSLCKLDEIALEDQSIDNDNIANDITTSELNLLSILQTNLHNPRFELVGEQAAESALKHDVIKTLKSARFEIDHQFKKIDPYFEFYVIPGVQEGKGMIPDQIITSETIDVLIQPVEIIEASKVNCVAERTIDDWLDDLI